ncbi:MAG: protein-disulfide reductase DsbD, partial [Campylobacteraceae bacterium]|nr:protein-disulfide reductase DsbD [Campylobacteraceae bacterium]
MVNSWFKKTIKLIFLLFFANISLYAALPKQKILSPQEAFKVSAKQNSDGLDIKIKLGEKMYVYDDKLHVELMSPKKILLDKESIRPKPVKFHEFIVHRKDININVPANVIKKYVKNGKYKIKVSYQGCSEVGLCYSPMSNTYDFTLTEKTFEAKVAPIFSKNNLSQEDSIANSIKNSSFYIVLLMFFGFGLLLSLTPCVFPMIPILSSIIVSQSGKNMNTKRAFILSLVYVLSMSLAYTIAGILAASFGANIQTALQEPWIIVTFSLIFVLLALSMFGFYEIQIPSFIQSKLSKTSKNSQNSGIVGVAIMGFLSALIVGPCIAAPLAGALIYIGNSGDVILGGSALFVMSLGMGVPLILIGIGAGKFMPRPGVWMNNIKAVFGVMMLAVAIYMLSRVVSGHISMLLWVALLLISSIYLGALEPLKVGATGWRKLLKGLGVLVFVYSLFMFWGALKGSTNPLDPLEEHITQISQTQNNKTEVTNNVLQRTKFKTVKTLGELNKIISNSKKPIMID